MGLLFWKKKVEERAAGEASFEDGLLTALLGGTGASREMAMQIPTISGGVDLIANIVAATPIKLYRDEGGKAVEVTSDPRLRLLNDETGDTLTANEFWRAMVHDYYFGKGGYAYIRRERGRWTGLHYVDERRIAINMGVDPIFKDYDLLVQGCPYKPFEFLKILRNTKDGASGVPITEQSGRLIEAAYEALLLERNMARRGGCKRGFLKSEGKLEQTLLDGLRAAFSKLYRGDNEDNFVVLNNKIDFKEASDTAVEMQMQESKAGNAKEFARILHVSADTIAGKGGDEDMASVAKLAAIPLMTTIQCALNRDFLLEREKGRLYWAFDTKELLKGGLKERYEAYQIGLSSHFLQVDEVRYREDLPALDFNYIQLGLNDVLYNPATKTIYTPNTNQTAKMDGLIVGAEEEKHEN